MTKEEKRQAALNILELRRSFGPPPNLASGDPLVRHLERMRGMMADLYSEHFSDQQLQGMLDFYESDLWKSIAETEFKFQKHFQKRMHELNRENLSAWHSKPLARLASTSDKPTIDIVADEGRSSSPWKLPARWRLEVRGQGDANVRFKAAIAFDGYLDLVEEDAPYDKEFSASRVIALFESVGEGNLSVAAFSDANGAHLRQSSGAGGRSVRIIFDPSISAYLSGSL